MWCRDSVIERAADKFSRIMDIYKYIDTHTHLYDEAFDSDLNETIDRIKEAGVSKVVFPGIDRDNFDRQSRVAALYPGFVYEAIGLHPTSVGANWRDELEFVREKLTERNGNGTDGGYMAVGEIGIDGYWSKEFIEEQKIVFKEQIMLAKEYRLPIIVHVRDAIEQVFEVLEDLGYDDIRGVFHAFSGSYETYCRLKKYGDIKIGIGGVVTYKNAGVAKVIEKVPLTDILLETDAPWLTPVPYRGKRNESTYIPVIAEKIAQIKGCSLEDVARVTTSNAEKLFAI